MAVDISNKTLAALVVAAIVVSLGGTLISLNKLGASGPIGATGAATSGSVTMSITQDTTIDVSDDTVALGSGYITGGAGSATINSAAGTSNTQWSGSEVSDYFQIENQGNVNVVVNVTSDKDASTFIGGTSPAFTFTTTNHEGSSCSSGLANDEPFSTTNATVCSALQYGNTHDLINVSVKVTIPSDATQTGGTASLTFWSSAV